MIDRDCANCGNRSDRGCKVWECEFKPVFSESKQLIIEELEKIKAEIKDEEDSTNWLVSTDVEKGWNDAVEYAIGKIDNRISELKGENK